MMVNDFAARKATERIAAAAVRKRMKKTALVRINRELYEVVRDVAVKYKANISDVLTSAVAHGMKQAEADVIDAIARKGER